MAFRALRFGELHGVDQGSMVEAVGKNGVSTPSQCNHHADVGHVAGRHQQGARKAGKGGEPPLQCVMRRQVAADEVRSAAADAPAASAGAGRLDQRRIGGQAQIVVTAKADEFTAVDDRQRPARGGQRAAMAAQAVVIKRGELGGQIVVKRDV